MSILQINIFKCELCETEHAVSHEVGMYDDPVVMPPDGEDWDYVEIDGKDKLLCPKCLLAETRARSSD